MTITTDISVEAVADGKMGRFVWLTGKNFSGRSAVLHEACAHYANSLGAAISIPPEIHNAISGLLPAVQEEILLHVGSREQVPGFWSLAEEWGLLRFSERDPFTLSGGEQSMLVVLCKLALKPKLLALDGALEQLDPDNLRKVLNLFSSGGSLPELPRIILTHNSLLPENGAEPIWQVPAVAIANVQRQTPPPQLEVTGFEPPRVLEPSTIHLVDFAFRYRRGATVFRNLNLRLESGRIYRLVGPNGSGKSTLARLLTGVLRPTHGEIRVNGKMFDSYSRPGTLARLHFQSPDSQLFESTVSDELNSLSAIAAHAAARFAGLNGFLDQHPFDLPFVLRKRLALTLILNTPAPWLIFDEPTLGQDEDARAVIGHALRRLAASGHGVILISHNAEFARSCFDEELNLPKLTNG